MFNELKNIEAGSAGTIPDFLTIKLLEVVCECYQADAGKCSYFL